MPDKLAWEFRIKLILGVGISYSYLNGLVGGHASAKSEDANLVRTGSLERGYLGKMFPNLFQKLLLYYYNQRNYTVFLFQTQTFCCVLVAMICNNVPLPLYQI